MREELISQLLKKQSENYKSKLINLFAKYCLILEIKVILKAKAHCGIDKFEK